MLDETEIEDEEPSPPSIERVKLRLMVLFANCTRSYTESALNSKRKAATRHVGHLSEWVFRELDAELTKGERELHSLAPGEWTGKQRIDNSWDFEAAVSLSWALGLFKEYPNWDQTPDLPMDFDDFPSVDSWGEDLALRPQSEIENQAMSAEARYWRIRDRGEPGSGIAYQRKLMQRAAKLGQVSLAADGDLALSDGRSVVALTEDEMRRASSIQSERLIGLNWLRGWEEDWDQVTPDTAVMWLWDREWPEDSTG